MLCGFVQYFSYIVLYNHACFSEYLNTEQCCRKKIILISFSCFCSNCLKTLSKHIAIHFCYVIINMINLWNFLWICITFLCTDLVNITKFVTSSSKFRIVKKFVIFSLQTQWYVFIKILTKLFVKYEKVSTLFWVTRWTICTDGKWPPFYKPMALQLTYCIVLIIKLLLNLYVSDMHIYLLQSLFIVS